MQVLDDLEPEYAEGAFEGAMEADQTFTREARRALLTPSLRDPEGVLTVEEEALASALREAEADDEQRQEPQQKGLPF